MKNFPNTLLALVFAAPGALFVPAAAAADLRHACVKNDMSPGVLMGMRVLYKHYSKSADASGPSNWRKSLWSPIVGKGKTACVDLSETGIREGGGFWIESRAHGKAKGRDMKCGRVIKGKSRGSRVSYVRQGSLFNKGVCKGPYYFDGCASCREGRETDVRW